MRRHGKALTRYHRRVAALLQNCDLNRSDAGLSGGAGGTGGTAQVAQVAQEWAGCGIQLSWWRREQACASGQAG